MGTNNDQCRRCYGTGEVYYPNPYTLSGRYLTCNSCNGTGICKHKNTTKKICDDCNEVVLC